MTTAEHLIENAINCLEDKSGYEEFIESPCNIYGKWHSMFTVVLNLYW